MERSVYISGMHSGQSPCAGVGIARSLKKAFPHIRLIGVDHWQGSSGLHHESLDDVLLLPQWKQIDKKRHAEFLNSLLEEGHLWISALDVEVYWLAQNFGTHPNLIVPSGTALEMTAKPQVAAFGDLGFRVPEYISAFSSDSEVHAFCRKNSWQCWLKGPYHEAKRVSSWSSFEKSRNAMKKEWKTKRLFLQKNVVGTEESVCFVAYEGKLLSAIDMQKRLITPEGKTWAGKVSAVSPEFFTKFGKIIRQLGWSGGGEIEFTRDPDGNKWIIECNPRFPAWIFGSALAGINLPAQILAEKWNLEFSESPSSYPCFTRVVQEIPARETIGLPMPPDPSLMGWISEGSKGKGGPVAANLMPRLRDHMDSSREEKDEEEDDFSYMSQSIPPDYSKEIQEITSEFVGDTPARVHLHQWTSNKFQNLISKLKKVDSSPKIQIAYSVKTSPTDQHLTHAREYGLLTECISQAEIHRALKCGVPKNEIILNGPGKFWPSQVAPVTGLHMLFCDSIEEFQRVISIPKIAKVVGYRIQLPKLKSRFGVPVDKLETFQKMVASIHQLNGIADLGFHFHMPMWAIGVQRWQEAVGSLVTWCQAIEQLTDMPVKHLDLGGGFFPSDLENISLPWLQTLVRKNLPNVEAIYFEPGRSLTQEGEIIVSRVLDVRRTKKNQVSEVVVDACIAELPMIHSYAHRVFYRPQPSSPEPLPLQTLNKGEGKILGRICMEDDVLGEGFHFPEEVGIGDYVIFGDAGAYERSMSYDFGRG